MADFPHIVRNESNQLVVEGTDIAVFSVIELLRADTATGVIIEQFPQLTEEVVKEIDRYRHFIETEELFSVKDLVKTYGDTVAIDNLTYSTTANSLGLFGPNASGKSTLIKILLGLVFPDEGEVRFDYRKEYLRVVPDFPNLPRNLTVDQWMDTLEEIYGPPNPSIDFEGLFNLRLDVRLKDLSAGQSRIAALLPVFFGTVKLVILDEPTNFLDAFIRDRVLRSMKKQFVSQGSKVIIASHRIDEINLFTERVLILHQGHMVADVPMSERSDQKYQVMTDRPDLFEELLEERRVPFEVSETAAGKLAILHLSTEFWEVVREFLTRGGVIHSISILDKLQVRLGEVLE